MKRVICASQNSQQGGVDAFQNKINELQAIKDKLEAKSNEYNADKVQKVTSFFVNEIEKMMDTYLKTVYDSTL